MFTASASADLHCKFADPKEPSGSSVEMEIIGATQEHRQPDRSSGDSGASTGDGENEGNSEVQV